MHPFSYDRFQEEAIAAIRQKTSVFVSAPTGAGKTVIAEVAVEEALKAGGMAIYTAPIKALSNQKYRDFHALYQDRVGILTGDVTLNPEAPLLIMTTEIYRNALFEESQRFARCRWIIFDEVHYLDDPERGTVWEEALLLTPRETEILALSATIPNAGQLAAWIEKIHGRPVKVVEETKRPVPLRFGFQCQDELHWDLGNLKGRGYRGFEHPAPRRPFRFRKMRGGRARFRKAPAGFMPPVEHRGRPNRADHLLKSLKEAGHLPCLYFTFSRKRSEDLAWEFCALSFSSPEARKRLLTEFDELCRKYEISHERSAGSMRELIGQGIAYHHAGLLPTLKEVVEILFSRRLIQVIVTTETFALGINMPARAVVLDTLRKRTDGPRMLLRVRELYQMCGRAGRRGMDEVGYVVLRVNPWDVSFQDLSHLIQGRPEEVSSRFNLTYATVLHLYRRTPENLLPFYEKTLHAHQASRAHQREAYELLKRKLTLLQEGGYLLPLQPGDSRGKLSHKGEFAASMYGNELLLSELFEQGVLDHLDLTDLGILLLAIVYEPRGFKHPPPLPHRVKGLARQVAQVLEEIHRLERRDRIRPFSKGASFHLSAALEQWVAGAGFDKVVQAVNEEEGSLIRYFRMTLQLCRNLMTSPAADAGLKEKAARLFHRINRDPVDAEAELRRSL